MPVRPVASRRARRVVRALFALAILSATPGCGIFSPHPGTERRQDPLPLNDTPQGAIERLQRTYARLDLADYTALLTTDFRYTFSAQSDPALVNQYGTNWGKDDETESAKHLFEGFVNTSGVAVAGASTIAVEFDNAQYYPDFAHADSARWYVYCPVSVVNLVIDVPPTTYYITAPHDFYLVRGDAAVLDAGQPRDSTRWYVRHWDDRSPAAPAGVAQGAPLAEASWGGLKGSYDR